MRIILLFLFLSGYSFGQIPKDANTILVKGVSFSEVCNALLDSGYVIDKKDNDLQTARTESKQYPKYWNARYVLNIRVKDSIAYISGTFTGADGALFKDDPISNHSNRKGETLPKSIYGYPFLLMKNFALSFNKPVEYRKQ